MSSPGLGHRLHRKVRFGEVSYDFYVANGSASWSELRRRLAELDTDRFVLIADRSLPPAVFANVQSHFEAIAPTLVVTLDPSETTKRLTIIDDLAERSILGGVTRQSCVVSLGGGLVGNMAGLLAALLYRGVRLIHLPTTLLGMSDSSLSMKQAVNSRNGKNHLGTFYAPVFVWNQLEFLDSLPSEEIQSALCETIKNVLCICPERYDEVAAKLRPDGRYSSDVIVDFIELCLDAKTKVMREDPHEKREALILEYGHTVGHALEIVSGGKLRHGFAIGVGMLAAARISRLLGYLSLSDEAAHKDLLQRNGAPGPLIDFWNVEEILRCVRLDNKRGYRPSQPNKCDFILLDELGMPHRDHGGLIVQVDEELVRPAIESVVFSKSNSGVN